MDVAGVCMQECVSFTARDALQAAFAHAGRERALNRFDRVSVERSIRDRLVDVAVKQGANAYVRTGGDLEQLRFFAKKRLPVLIAVTTDDATNDACHFAIVVGVDDQDEVELLCRGEQGKPAVTKNVPAAELVRRWY